MTTTTDTTRPYADAPGMIPVLLDGARQATEEANAIAERYAAANVNVNKAIKELREDPNTEDKNVKRAQEALAALDQQREEIISKINAYLAKQVGAEQMSDEDKDKVRAEHKTQRETREGAISLARKQAGWDDSFLEGMPDLMRLSGGRASAGQTGIRRPRLSEVTLNGEQIEGKQTFSNLATALGKLSGEKVKPSDLSAAAFEAAGTDDLSTVNDVSFNYSVKGTDYEITVIPQARETDAEEGDAA